MYVLGEKDTHDIINMNSDLKDKANIERRTELLSFIPELYEEIDNSTQQINANVAIAPSSQVTSRDVSKTKQQ